MACRESVGALLSALASVDLRLFLQILGHRCESGGGGDARADTVLCCAVHTLSRPPSDTLGAPTALQLGSLIGLQLQRRPARSSSAGSRRYSLWAVQQLPTPLQ